MTPTSKLPRYSLVAVLLLASAGQAAAASVVYSSRALFDAATTNQTLRTFEGLAPIEGFTLYDGGLTVNGVTFTSLPTLTQPVGNRILVVDGGFCNCGGYFFNSGQWLNDNTTPSNTHVTLPAGTMAWGADLSELNSTLQDITISMSTGEVFTVSHPDQPNFAFFGVTSAVPITVVDFTFATQSGQPTFSSLALDNFVTADLAGTSPVPEPATLILLCTGLAAAIGRRRQL
jgi:hypothetical protein